MSEVTLNIANMSCGACIRRVTQTLNALPGTHAEEVRLGLARVRTDADDTTLVAALGSAGFPAHIDSSSR
jgi:copper chaperone CopZ